MKEKLKAAGEWIICGLALIVMVVIAAFFLVGGLISVTIITLLILYLVPILMFLVYLYSDSSIIQMISVIGIWLSASVQTGLVVYFLMKNNSNDYSLVEEMEDTSTDSEKDN